MPPHTLLEKISDKHAKRIFAVTESYLPRLDQTKKIYKDGMESFRWMRERDKGRWQERAERFLEELRKHTEINLLGKTKKNGGSAS